MKLISVEKMKELESAANAAGYSYEKMMLRAGEGVARVVHETFYSGEHHRVLGLVGGGNNGGDTLIALYELQKIGWECSAVMLKEDKQLSPLILKFSENGGKIAAFEQLDQEIGQADVLLDGIIGTGFKPPLQEAIAKILQRIGELSAEKIMVAVDCPSGVDCITGEVSPETLKADLTISMEAVKEGMLRLPAFEACGELATVELGIPQKNLKPFENGQFVIDTGMVEECLPARPSNSHKGTYGHLIVCGGCVNYSGAPMLAAMSAYRAGAGLVECAIPERIYDAAAANHTECIYTVLEDEDGVIAENAAATLVSRLEAANGLLLGPGIGKEEPTFRFFQRFLFEGGRNGQGMGVGFVPGATKKSEKSRDGLPTMVIDADGLRLLARIDGWEDKLKCNVVLTPHAGEMSALTGLTVDEIQKNRWKTACDFSQKWKQVVVLKGALTVISAPDGRMAVLPFASSALSKAGTGDVLAGIIAGLIAQGVNPFEAAVAGAWLHAKAAEYVMLDHGSERCLLAGDLIDAIPDAMAEVG